MKNKKNVMLFVIVILVVIALSIGAYIILGKDSNKNYILDSRETNQEYKLNFDELDKTGEVNKLGYIKLDKKSLNVSYTLNPESLNWMDISGTLKIDDKSFEVDSEITIYILEDSILISEPIGCSVMIITLLDNNLKTVLKKELVYDSYDNNDPKFIDWNKKTATYYRRLEAEDYLDASGKTNFMLAEYQIDFSSNQDNTPKLINKFEATNIGCGGK